MDRITRFDQPGRAGLDDQLARAGLANYDDVHFMGAGYQKLADMPLDQLMIEYAKYTLPTPRQR